MLIKISWKLSIIDSKSIYICINDVENVFFSSMENDCFFSMEHVKHIMENMDYYGFILINMEHPLGTIMENTDYYGYGKYEWTLIMFPNEIAKSIPRLITGGYRGRYWVNEDNIGYYG